MKKLIAIIFILLAITISKVNSKTNKIRNMQINISKNSRKNTIPKLISFQGELINDDVQLNGNYNMIFKLYTSISDETAIWSENQDNTPVIAGLFNVILGSKTPLNLPFDKQYFMSIAINNGEEFTPRTPLTASPYAFTALTADNANFAETAADIDENVAVKSLNNKQNEVKIVAGSNIEINNSGEDIVVSANVTGIGNDNLGNHEAEQNIALNGNWLSNNGNNNGLIIDNEGNVALYEKNLQNIDTIKANFLCGNGSLLTNISDKDELVKVGASGTAAYLSEIDFKISSSKNQFSTKFKNRKNKDLEIKINDNAIVTEKIKNNSVTETKLAINNEPSGGNVLKYNDLRGGMEWGTVTGNDNLGNHTATQNIILNDNWLSNNGEDKGMKIDEDGNIAMGALPLTSTKLNLGVANNTGLNIDSTGNNGIVINSANWIGMLIRLANDDGVYITKAGNPLHDGETDLEQHNGFEIVSAENFGLKVGYADEAGIYVNSAGNDGIYVGQTGNPAYTGVSSDYYHNGFEVGSAEHHGVKIGYAGNDGLNISRSDKNGIYVSQAADEGVHINKAGDPAETGTLDPSKHNGFEVISTEHHGVRVGYAGNDGLNIEKTGGNGISIFNTNSDGIYLDYAGDEGIQIVYTENNGMSIQYAMGDAIFANTAKESYEWGLYTPDKIYSRNVTTKSLSVYAINKGEESLQTGDLVCIAGNYSNLKVSEQEQIEIISVQKINSNNSENILGVVEYKTNLKEKVEVLKEGKREIRKSLQYAQGDITHGDYLSIIVFGIADVKIENNAIIKAGESLTGGKNGARKIKTTKINQLKIAENVGNIGKALENSNGKKMIKVFINCK